jgi:NAD(P)-dependent dehydrogenase (short-subunit alcohol dehydrogenase family)
VETGCYLITGAGGYGKVLAQWLADRGARHLVLTSRSGASSPEAGKFVADLEKRGVEVRVALADVGAPNDVRQLFAEINSGAQPLRGVFHLAMVIDDAPLAALTPERLRNVLDPKAQGAWLLHEATREMNLDCFVMFSSVSSIFGNPAQGNYSAANAFIDSLAHHRQALGLPALTVNWGVLGGEGYVARNERVADFLARQGTMPISPSEATALLESFLRAGSAQVIAIRVDWAKWRQFFRSMQANPLLERIFAAIKSEESTGATSDWRNRIDAAGATENRRLSARLGSRGFRSYGSSQRACVKISRLPISGWIR